METNKRRVWGLKSEAPYLGTPESAAQVQHRVMSRLLDKAVDQTIKARGRKETRCRLDYGTGEMQCEHRAAIPHADCRQRWCHHAPAMRTRVAQRLYAAARKLGER